MSSHFRFFTIALVGIMIFPACKSTKKATEQTAAASTTHHTEEVIKVKNESEYISKLAERTLSPAWFRSAGSINASLNGNELDLDAVIQIRKDSAIMIVLKKFGFEGGRILINQDSVFIINRLEQNYDKLPLQFLAQKFNIPAQYAAIQAILLGNAVQLDTKTPFEAHSQDSSVVITAESGAFSGTYTFEKARLHLLQSFFIDEKSASKMTMYYEDYKTTSYKNVSFSHQRNIAFFSPSSGNGEITLEFSDVEMSDTPKSIKFSIPSHYKRKLYVKN